MKLCEMPRLIRTMRHLRCSQIVWRSRYVLERSLPVRARMSLPRADLASEELVPRWQDFPDVPLLHRPGPDSAEVVRLLAEGSIRHLNHSQIIGFESPDWHLGLCRSDRLWVITLQYHAWAHALAEQASAGDCRAAAALEHLLSDWIDRCRQQTPGARTLAWNSYAVATRLGWWARLHGLLGKQFWDARPRFQAGFLESFAKQAAYLHTHLEWDLRANHLLRDAVGLAWAGRLLRGEQAQRWLQTATRLALAQASEQFLADGGHFERSPMYHVLVMEDLLSLCLLLEDPDAVAQLAAHWKRAAEALAWLRHPDGGVPLLNDGALNGTCPPAAMLAAAPQLGLRVDSDRRRGGKFFPASGIAVWHGCRWSVFFDVGPLGPSYQPGHGHADTLSVEASFDSHRLLVDPGTFGYDDDDRRRYDRSTRSHNTIVVDGQDSSELWGIFRAGRRAVPHAVDCQFSDGEMLASAAHNGYDHLGGRPRHHRSVAVTEDQQLMIVDRVSGLGSHRLEGAWLLAPQWRASQGASGWMLSDGRSEIHLRLTTDSRLRLNTVPAKYHPEYGLELDTTRIEWTYQGQLPFELRTVVAAA